MIPVIGALFNFKKLMLPLIIVTVIGGLIFSGKNYIDNKDETITTLQSVIGSKNIEINQLNNNISTLNGTVIGLKDEIIESKYRRRLVENQVANLRRVNSAVQEELRKKEKKLAGRDLKELQSGRQRELVLKIINKSILKQFKIFDEEQSK